jgi:pilus assembly protein CpaE
MIPQGDPRLTIVLLEASPAREALVRTALAETAIVAKDLAFLPAAPQARVVLVDLAGDPERALATLEQVHFTLPSAQLAALADSKDSDLILRAMRAGAREFTLLGDAQELVEVVTKLQRRGAAEEISGVIVSVLAAKGGVGATTLATNLAAALVSPSHRVLLIDFDRQANDVLVFLDMAPRQSIAEVVKNLRRFDRELLLASLARHGSGMYVLAQADSLEEGDTVGAADVTALLQLAARHFDFVVCDGLRGFGEVPIAVLDASSRIELVLTQDVVALKNAKRRLDVCRRLAYDEGKIDVVVNRFDPKATIDVASIGETLGLAVSSTLAFDPTAALSALNRGVLLQAAAPRSKLTHDVSALADRVTGVSRDKKRGFFESLFGQRGAYDVTRHTPEAS